MNIENLVFKGGGVLGEAYAGAYTIVSPLAPNVKRVAGTSAGAMMALMVALGYTPDEITRVLDATPFDSFMDRSSWIGHILNELRYYGLYTGDALMRWIQAQIKNKTGANNITFSDLRNLGYLDLTVVATNDITNEAVYFNCANTPNTIVAEAVRCSIAIPLFFRAFKPSQGEFTGVTFVDGGVVNNYPISLYDRAEGANEATLGLFLHHDAPSSTLSEGHLLASIKDTFLSIVNAQDVDFFAHPQDVARSIIIDSLGLSATDFNISKADAEALKASGKLAAQHFFAKNL